MTRTSGLTEDQIKARSGKLGGSDIPSVLGVSPYKTKRELALEKLGMQEPSSSNPRAMLRGTLLEPVVAKLWKQETGIWFAKPAKTFTHPDHDWLVGHFDGLTASKELVEIKTMNMSKYMKTKREGLPVEITSQVQAYLSWPKLKKAYVVVFSAEVFEYFTVEMEPDIEFQEIIFREGSQFVSDLKAGILPPEDQQPVIDLPKVSTGEVLWLNSAEFVQAVNELREAQEIVKESKELEESAKATIIRMMNGFSVVESEGLFRAYFREQAGRRSFQEKAFRQAHPEIDLSKFYKVGEKFRSFKGYFLSQKGNA